MVLMLFTGESGRDKEHVMGCGWQDEVSPAWAGLIQECCESGLERRGGLVPINKTHLTPC